MRKPKKNATKMKNINNGYAYVTKWSDFKAYPTYSINQAIKNKENTPTYKVVKTI